ncbi:CheR family methyltransferase [Afifella sp. H1R]|uniref:CheR family methyltransferase n=1 Tax=unclassified Afifella TaxID=2624128 RepID=UPI001F45B7A2|nr:protein-glutamate O-methyltransferase CheR [Afifella sp. H1R]MCF1503861.1 protein-glutamate O-methyltransferase CheR [Afifella sp. H1R]
MITPADYEFFQRYLKAQSGLVLQEGKTYLLESRLLPVATHFGLPSIAALAAKLRQGSMDIGKAVVDAMTTNESFFFRDKTPFDLFSDVMLPTLLRNRPVTQPLRIWCAAASSGQEPYSLAMILREKVGMVGGRKVEIIATDISDDMLKRASAGIYTQFEVQRGLPVQLLLKYFKKSGENWQISDDIRRMVTFRNLNLLHSFTTLGMLDIVFCRNVLIYFDAATKGDILDRVSRNLRPDGYLVLGGAETVVGVSSKFTLVPGQRNLYGLAANQSAVVAA